MTLPAVQFSSRGISTVRAGPNSSHWRAQLLYYSHSDVESRSYSKNKSTSTPLCKWTMCVHVLRGACMKMHACHASSVSISPLCISACMCTVTLWHVTIRPYLLKVSISPQNILCFTYSCGFFLGSCLTVAQLLLMRRVHFVKISQHTLGAQWHHCTLARLRKKAVVDSRKSVLI